MHGLSVQHHLQRGFEALVGEYMQEPSVDMHPLHFHACQRLLASQNDIWRRMDLQADSNLHLVAVTN